MAPHRWEEELGLQCSRVFTERNLKNIDNKGTFKSALTQSFKSIKETKAAAITEDVELSYRRKIEDLCRSARQCDRDREGNDIPKIISGMILESYNRQKSSGEIAVTEHNEHLL